MTIAVTGATGALGSLVIDALIERVPADQIVALVRDPQKAASLTERGVAVRPFDYDQPEALAGELAGVTDLLLISGTALGRRFAQHSAVIDAAQAAGVGRIAYTSVLNGSSELNPVSPEHVQTEKYLEQADITSVILRNGWYHENYLGQLETGPQTGAVLTSAGDGRVSSAARADYAAAAAVVLTTPDVKPVYELAGDTAWSFDDLAAAVSEVTGTTVGVARVDAAVQTETLKAAGLDDGTVGFIVGIDAAIKAGELADSSGELSALIGRPTTPLIEVLRNA